MSDDLFFPVAERRLYIPLRDGSFKPSGWKALIREARAGNGITPLAAVRDSYKLVTHKEVYDALLPVLKPYDVGIDTYFDRDGAKGYIDVIFHGVVTALAGDRIKFRAIIHNGYGGASFGAKIGAISAFCTNGMIIGEYETTYRRHTSGLDASIVGDWIKRGLEKWDVATVMWHRWATAVYDREIIYPMASKAWELMSDNEQHRAKMDSTWLNKYVPQYGLSKFSVYQTLTDYASHFDDYKSRAVNSNSPHERELAMLTKAEAVMEKLTA